MAYPTREDNIMAARKDGTFDAKVAAYNKAGRSTGYSMDSGGNIFNPYSGISQPQRMSRGSVFGAMRSNNATQREYPNQRLSGIDTFRMKQNRPSAYSLNTGLAGPDALAEMQENYNELLPPSLQRSTPVGRSRHSPERIAERELRAKSRQLDRILSPFY